MNHLDLVEKVKNHFGEKYTKKEIKEILDKFLEITQEAIITGRPVTLKGIGVLQKIASKKKEVTIPWENKTVPVKPFRVQFRISKSLKDKI